LELETAPAQVFRRGAGQFHENGHLAAAQSQASMHGEWACVVNHARNDKIIQSEGHAFFLGVAPGENNRVFAHCPTKAGSHSAHLRQLKRMMRPEERVGGSRSPSAM